MIIRWTNKYSGEQGFVKKLNRVHCFFENTFDSKEALSISSRGNSVQTTIALLDAYCPDNTYEAVDRRTLKARKEN